MPLQAGKSRSLFDFFKINILADFAVVLLFRGRRVGMLRRASLLMILVHPFVHFPETLFYLFGSAVNRNNKMKDQPVQQVDQKAIK